MLRAASATEVSIGPLNDPRRMPMRPPLALARRGEGRCQSGSRVATDPEVEGGCVEDEVADACVPVTELCRSHRELHGARCARRQVDALEAFELPDRPRGTAVSLVQVQL